MRFNTARIWFLSLMLVWALSHASVWGVQNGPAPKAEAGESGAERIRKALDQTMALDYSAGSLQEIATYLKEKLRANVVIDVVALQQMGIGFDDGQAQVHLKGDRNTKVRAALQRLLNGYGLTYVILQDSVLITTDEIALHRQMRQRISVSYQNTPLAEALKDMSRAHAINLLLDPRAVVEASSKVSLQLDDATLETCVRLLAEMASLKSVRMGNVLFVTNEVRAEKLRREEPGHGGNTNNLLPLGLPAGP